MSPRQRIRIVVHCALAVVCVLLAWSHGGCGVDTREKTGEAPTIRSADEWEDPTEVAARTDDCCAKAREEMVESQIEGRGITDARVLAAMRTVPRHVFAAGSDPERAYDDRPHSIGHAQTISQPYIVALMTELAQLSSEARVLEIGTGSGYQAAVLAEIAAEVYSIEIVVPLAKRAKQILTDAGYGKVHLRTGDGYLGWPEAAPFDAILITAAAPRVPQPLIDQLALGGRLVVPVDQESTGFLASGQTLEVYERTPTGIVREKGISVRFVPMTGGIRAEPAEPLR